MDVARLADLMRPLLAVTAAQRAFFASDQAAQREYDVSREYLQGRRQDQALNRRVLMQVLKGIDVLPCALQFLTSEGCPFGGACPLPHAWTDGRRKFKNSLLLSVSF